MKRISTLAALVSLTFAGCGSHSGAKVERSLTTGQTGIVSAKFEADLKRCLPTHARQLLSKAGRRQFEICAIAPAKRQAFGRCLADAVLSGVPSAKRIKNDALGCGSKEGL